MINVLIQYGNCEEWLEKCITSLLEQSDVEYRAVIMDDVSTDRSVEIVKSLISDHSNIAFVERVEKYWQARNVYDHAHGFCDDGDIAVHLDGDDWFPNKFVLKRVQELYQKDKDLWMTWGSYVCASGAKGLSAPLTDWDGLRTGPWVTSHLRTYKAWLCKKILPENLTYYGNWTTCTGDKFFMYPMLEMSGPEHAKFVPDTMYVYNDLNPQNEHKVRFNKQISAEYYVRSLKPYERIVC